MKVLFLDFDGVLNSAASFMWEQRKKTINVANTLSPINCSNLQYILEKARDVKVVISSTWRHLHTMVELQNILNGYGVEAARVIGKTPGTMGNHRGREIRMWLDANPNVTQYAILDDDPDAGHGLYMEEGVVDMKGHFFMTDESDGLSLTTAIKVAKLFRGESNER